MGGQGMLGQNLTYVSHHISHFGYHQTLLSALFVCYVLSFLQRLNSLFYLTISASSSGGSVYTEIRGSAGAAVSVCLREK